MEKLAIVNADDLGFSQGTTDGIVRAHRDGIVTSTTIIANGPAAEAAAGQIGALPGLGVGVHLNVCQGRPLSKAGAALAGEDGLMRHTGMGLLAACVVRPWLLGAVEAEFDAQIRWALDHGIRPTHLDSHRHSHGFPPIFAVAGRLARRYKVPYLRWHGEWLPGGGWPAVECKQRGISAVLGLFGVIDRLLAPDLRATRGTWGIAHTGRIDEHFLVRASAAIRPGVTEIMVHPGLPDDPDGPAQAGLETRLVASRQAELDALCRPAVRDAFSRNSVRLVHYGQI